MLRCSDKKCEHVPPPPPLPIISDAQLQLDISEVHRRFEELAKSNDKRIVLLSKCLKSDLKWAGSSFIVFLGGGVEKLLDFLSETTLDGTPAHDIDLYRTSKEVKGLGKRFVTNAWKFTAKSKGSVNKISLVENMQVGIPLKLEVDQVNVYKGTTSPSTDLWPNFCATYKNEGS